MIQKSSSSTSRELSELSLAAAAKLSKLPAYRSQVLLSEVLRAKGRIGDQTVVAADVGNGNAAVGGLGNAGDVDVGVVVADKVLQ